MTAHHDDETVQTYALLFLAYGGPDSLDDVEEYLLDIRGGRETPKALVEEIKERYALIGGRSPLLEITRAQSRAVADRLNAELDGLHFVSYVGMRHWRPYIRETIADVVANGHDSVVAIVMAPHYSRMSVGKYREQLEAAIEDTGALLDVTFIGSWHDHPGFIEAIANNVHAARRRFPAAVRDDVTVVFTAHSLPAALIQQGDPYDEQLRETARLVAERAGIAEDRWTFSYQSAGASTPRVKWLGPQIEDVVVELAEAGRTNILVVPVGFVADHVEILYDIDIEARQEAEKAGARLERTESMNTNPQFIAAVADIVQGAVLST